MKKVVSRKTNEGWVMVGIIVITLLLLLAYIIKANKIDEEENRSIQTRMVNKVQEVRNAKNAIKKVLK